MSTKQWHQAAIADTGDSYYLVGRQYVIGCAWCEAVFIAPTKNEALTMLRIHETQMLGPGRRILLADTTVSARSLAEAADIATPTVLQRLHRYPARQHPTDG